MAANAAELSWFGVHWISFVESISLEHHQQPKMRLPLILGVAFSLYILIETTMGYSAFSVHNAPTRSNRRKRCALICSADQFEPVCGTDGETYRNECLLRSAISCNDPNLRKAHDGECGSPRPECRNPCPFNYVPVCGSDGRTYRNDCELKQANCKDISIRKHSNGECGSGQPPCPGICPPLLQPICGTDGQDYANECELLLASCEKDPTIRKASDGFCGSTIPGGCHRDCHQVTPDPVCGSDGLTYSSECDLSNASCDDPSVQLVGPGHCDGSTLEECHRDCHGEKPNPICGSDGRTYNSECDLSNASCEDPSVKIIGPGPCGYQEKTISQQRTY